MSIRFAGSRFVHERRRRRLAQECGGVSIVPVEDHPGGATDESDSELPPAATLGHSSVLSVIRPELWVHWTITVLCFLAWAGMLYVGDVTEQSGIGLRDILGIRSGRVTTFFSTIMLLWAGQLSLLIYWYRRKSRNDFQGRYRVWLWIGAMLQLFLAVSATGAHVPFAQYMQRVWPLDIPLYGLFCWLVPVATLSLTMYRLLRIELKRHRSGKFLLSVAGTAGLIAAVSLVIGPLLPERSRNLIQIGSATLTHLGLATALLMHARYVIHICNEAPRKVPRTQRVLLAARRAAEYLPIPKKLRPSGLSGMATAALVAAGRNLPRPSLSRLRRFQLPQWNRATAASDSDDGATKPSPEKTKRTAPKESRVSATTSQSQSAIETKAVLTSRKRKRKRPQTREQQTAEPVNARAQAPPQASRSLDSILDDYGANADLNDDTLRGLSKKQRRRLRKKQRELQQAGH